MNSSFSENDNTEINYNNKKKMNNFKSFKDLFNEKSNMDDSIIQINNVKAIKAKYDISDREKEFVNNDTKENLILDIENRLAKRNSLNLNSNKYFNVYENKNCIDFEDFPIDGNALKSIVIEFNLLRNNNDENLCLSNNAKYSDDLELNTEITKYLKRSLSNDSIVLKQIFNRLKTEFVNECNEKISKSYFSYIKQNFNSLSDISSTEFKLNKAKNHINFFDLKNKDYLFNGSNNTNSKEYNMEILQNTTYYQTVTSLYKKFLEGKVRHFYIVSLFMTCYFVNETIVSEDSSNNDSNLNIKSNKNNKLRLYISEYYKSLENNLKESNIEFTKISNDNLIEKIRNQEAKEKKTVSLQNLDSNTFSDMEKFFANTNDFIDDNMTSLIVLKGVNMNLFFNLFINGSQSKGFIIFSDTLFSNCTYSENFSKEVEMRDLKVKLRMYGCFFPNDMININNILYKKSTDFSQITKEIIYKDISENANILNLINRKDDQNNKNIESKLKFEFKSNLSKKTTNLSTKEKEICVDNINNNFNVKSQEILKEISEKISEELISQNSISCHIELDYLDRIKRYFILNKKLSGSIKKIHCDFSNQQNKYKVIVNS